MTSAALLLPRQTLLPMLISFEDVSPAQSLFDWRALGGLLVVVGTSALAMLLLRRRRVMSLGFVIPIFTLGPVTNLIVPVAAIAGTRFLYQSLLGFGIVAGISMAILWHRNLPWTRAAAVVIGLWLIPCMAIQADREVDTWRDDLTLFQTATERTESTTFGRALAIEAMRTTPRAETLRQLERLANRAAPRIPGTTHPTYHAQTAIALSALDAARVADGSGIRDDAPTQRRRIDRAIHLAREGLAFDAEPRRKQTFKRQLAQALSFSGFFEIRLAQKTPRQAAPHVARARRDLQEALTLQPDDFEARLRYATLHQLEGREGRFNAELRQLMDKARPLWATRPDARELSFACARWVSTNAPLEALSLRVAIVHAARHTMPRTRALAIAKEALASEHLPVAQAGEGDPRSARFTPVGSGAARRGRKIARALTRSAGAFEQALQEVSCMDHLDFRQLRL